MPLEAEERREDQETTTKKNSSSNDSSIGCWRDGEENVPCCFYFFSLLSLDAFFLLPSLSLSFFLLLRALPSFERRLTKKTSTFPIPVAITWLWIFSLLSFPPLWSRTETKETGERILPALSLLLLRRRQCCCCRQCDPDDDCNARNNNNNSSSRRVGVVRDDLEARTPSSS